MGHVLEVDDNGRLIITPDLLSDAAPHTRYVAEAQEGGLWVRLESEDVPRLGWDDWWERWQALASEITAASTTDRSAVDILSEMRR